MKRSFFALLATFAAVSAHAGSFGGPPPFSNGSPLVTGVDGSYQASARATNVSGIIRFQYASGVQTSSTSQNNWIFFINGQIQRGSTVANIDSNKVDGVMDSLSAGSSTNSNGTIALPVVLLNANNAASGYFRGKMSLNGDFNGSGQLQASPASTNQIIAISQIDAAAAFNPGAIVVTNASYTNAAGTLSNTPFKFRGVRATTTTSSSSSSTSTN